VNSQPPAVNEQAPGCRRRVLGRAWRRGRLARFLLAVLAALTPAHAWATPAWTSSGVAPVSPTAAPPALAPQDEFGRGTPRSAVAAFLEATARHDYRRAANLLDLRGIPPGEAAQRGPILARLLRVVLDNTPIDIEALSDEAAGRKAVGVPAGRDIIGRVAGDGGGVSIVLEQVPRDDGVRVWKFSRATLARVPELYQKFTYGIVGEWLPPFLLESRVFGIAPWQWIGLVLLIAAALFVASLLVRPSLPIVRWLFARLSPSQEFLLTITAPTRLLVALAVFRAGRIALGLPLAVEPVVGAIERFLLVITVTWLAFRLIDTAGALARHSLLVKSEMASLPIVELAQRAMKIMVAVFAALMLLEAVGVQVSALIAAIGVGGIGLALAAQRTVENLFGGLAVIGDQPVRVGDFCRFGDRQGTVERIGLWSTRVRTLDRSVVSVPNAQFASLQIENLTRRDRILFEAKLPLRYETTPDQLRWLLVRLRELLYAHPRVEADRARVRFTGFGPSSLRVEIFAYIPTTDYEDYLAVREDLYLRIMDIVAAAGTALAMPSQVNYSGAEGLEPERARTAAAEVQRWREAGQLPLPEFPPERVKALGGTLDYPPTGSADRSPRADRG